MLNIASEINETKRQQENLRRVEVRQRQIDRQTGLSVTPKGWYNGTPPSIGLAFHFVLM